MFSIGILGFIVWSLLVGLFNSDIKVINFAIYWNNQFNIITKIFSDSIMVNLMIEPVRNNMCYSFCPIFIRAMTTLNNKDKYNIVKSSSENVRETSFNFT